MGSVVTLPSAAGARVRQPEYHRRWKLIREGSRAGNIFKLPCQHYQAPALRREAVEREEKAALYAEGGIARNAPTLLLGALLTALEPQEQQTVLDRLQLMSSAIQGPAPMAALTYAKSILKAQK